MKASNVFLVIHFTALMFGGLTAIFYPDYESYSIKIFAAYCMGGLLYMSFQKMKDFF